MSAVIGFAKGWSAHPVDIISPLSFDYVWLESSESVLLGHNVPGTDWAEVERWPAGRLFGQAGEYRWELITDGRLHAVLLLDDHALPSCFEGVVEIRKETDEDLVLWGKWVYPEGDPEGNPDRGPRFYASEIPQVQTYPIDLNGRPKDNETPRLTILRYRDTQGDKGEFVRCVGFKMKPMEEDQYV